MLINITWQQIVTTDNNDDVLLYYCRLLDLAVHKVPTLRHTSSLLLQDMFDVFQVYVVALFSRHVRCVQHRSAGYFRAG